jgi:hypothetical protein
MIRAIAVVSLLALLVLVLYVPSANPPERFVAQLRAEYGMAAGFWGAYNAACTQLKGQDCQRARSRYAWQVYRRLPTSRGRMQAGPVTPSSTAETAGASHLILTARVSP